MQIAIIGSGNVGAALGSGWLTAGHQVVFGIRNPDSPKARKLAEWINNPRLTSIPEAVQESGVIVITTPPDAILELIPQFGDLTEKIVVDATNSVRNKPDPYPTVFHAIKAVTGAESVVKCFNTTGFENMLHPAYELIQPVPHTIRIDMFAAGSSQQAKATVMQLSADLGFETCYDFGGDDKVELLEKFALSWINLAITQGYGRNIAFKLVRRNT
jgi:hypothetical protein